MRRCGVPCLVIVGSDFEERALLDCDDGGSGMKLVTKKGAAAVDSIAGSFSSRLGRGGAGTVASTAVSSPSMSTPRAAASRFTMSSMATPKTERRCNQFSSVC